MDKAYNSAIYYYYNFLIHFCFKTLIYAFTKDIIGHKITQVMAKAELRL